MKASSQFLFDGLPFRPHAVTPGYAFRFFVTELWQRTLRRRSQKDGMTWERITRLANDWLPNSAQITAVLTNNGQAASPSRRWIIAVRLRKPVEKK